MGAKLTSTVYVRDPDTFETVRLDAGTEPEPRLAALVTNPAAWEDGKLPPAAKRTAEATAASSEDDSGDSGGDTKQATATAGARRPARGRKTADSEGVGGQ